MWSYDAKLIDVSVNGKLVLELSRELEFPYDFGFRVRSTLKHRMTSIQEVSLKDVSLEYLFYFEHDLKVLLPACNWIKAITFPCEDGWEALIYAENTTERINPKGEFCLNTELLEAGKIIFGD